MSEPGQVYPAGEVARLLDSSESGTRRYAKLYEQLYGDLPRDAQKRRLWTYEAVTRVGEAKRLLDAGKVPSIKAGLEALLNEPGDTSPARPPDHPTTPQADALRRLGEALDTVRRLEQTNQELVREVRALREKLEDEDPNAAELRRMNEYLMRELEVQRETRHSGDFFSPLKRLYRWLYRKD